MNLINCSANCAHQKEGFCMVEKLSPSANVTSGECLYFSPKEARKKGLTQKPAYFTDSTNPK